jgi:hypothetical protein
MPDTFEDIAKLKGTRLNGVFFPAAGVPIGPCLIVEADETERTVTVRHDSGKTDLVQFPAAPAEADEK